MFCMNARVHCAHANHIYSSLEYLDLFFFFGVVVREKVVLETENSKKKPQNVYKHASHGVMAQSVYLDLATVRECVFHSSSRISSPYLDDREKNNELVCM